MTIISDRLAACATVDALLDIHARDRPSNVALKLGSLEITYGDLSKRVSRLAAKFVAEGLQPGDRVALLAKNDPAFCELMMAASKTGVVLVPVNFRLAPAEVEFIVQDSGAKLFFASSEFLTMSQDVATRCPDCNTVVQISNDGQYSGWITDAPAPAPTPFGRETTLFQMYTSGTTGQPKGVLITQSNVFALMENGCRYLGSFDETTQSLVCMPLFHAAGNAWLFMGLAAGSCNDLVVDIDASALIEQIKRNQISCTLLVPTVILMITSVAEAQGITVRGLKTISFGASPMPAELLKRAQKVFPDTDFIHVYGMTETTCMFTWLDPAELKANRRLESCGVPFEDAEVKIVDPDGNDLPVGVAGEIVCRTPQIMAGYWKRPEATANVIRDGWFHTGDAGYLDEEGYLFIRDRIKDMVISGGENVYPAEVENAVLAHPSVADVAVIGIPDDKWGEIVLAAIVVKDGLTVEDQDIKTTVRERLAGYKVPKRIERLKALPRNGAGKLTKGVLRDMFATAK